MTRLAFVDTETTGLDPHYHEIWEVGLIVREDDGTETEHVWQLPVELARADPIALNIGRFHDRRGDCTDRRTFAGDFCRLTRGAHLVGAVVSFDERRLWDYAREQFECPMWHYHLIDVEALAVGYLMADARRIQGEVDLRALSALGPSWRRGMATPPWTSSELSEALGVNPAEFEKHTALGDAHWARAMYDAVMSPT